MKGNTMEKQLIKMMLNKNFFNEYKGVITRNVFEGELGSFFESLQKAHKDYEGDLKVDDVYTLHVGKFNPALTRTAKEKFEELVIEIKETTDPTPAIAKDIANLMVDRETAQKIAIEATEIFNGKPANFNDIIKIIEGHKKNLPDEGIKSVTNDIGEVLEQLSVTTKWGFNIPVLKEKVGGIGPGNLMVAFARPETGKTAFWVSLVSAPDGFAWQGAKVHAFINEEPAIRTEMRTISCSTGYTRDEIPDNMEEVHYAWSKVKDNIFLFDVVDWTLDDIDSHCEKYKPDIIVIDQLDKVNLDGKFSRSDEKLRAIYTGAREIAKRRDCAVIAISQASADAHNRDKISFDMMENSKTGKAAEADLIIGIGRNAGLDTENRNRTLNISKNKITGYHGEPSCVIRREISRYEG
jgi:replicative DNA helicase